MPLRSLHVALRPENRQAGKGSGLRWLGIRATRDHPHAVYYSRTGTPPTGAAPTTTSRPETPPNHLRPPILPPSRKPRPSTSQPPLPSKTSFLKVKPLRHRFAEAPSRPSRENPLRRRR